MKKLAVISGLLALGVILTSAILLGAENDKKQLEKAHEWKRAAENRESAAATQEAEAERLLEMGREFRSEEYLQDVERKANLNLAGDAEKRAGDLEGAASVNLERAAANWEIAAQEYKKLDEAQEHKNATAMAEAARRAVLAAYGKAARAYESAAEAYSEKNANQSDKGSAASERAAVWGEKLAARK